MRLALRLGTRRARPLQLDSGMKPKPGSKPLPAGAENSTLHRMAFADATKSITTTRLALRGMSDLSDYAVESRTPEAREAGPKRGADRFALRLITLSKLVLKLIKS